MSDRRLEVFKLESISFWPFATRHIYLQFLCDRIAILTTLDHYFKTPMIQMHFLALHGDAKTW